MAVLAFDYFDGYGLRTCRHLFLVEALVNGQFATALHRLAALMLIVGPAWRYRKECVACLRHGEQQ
jgi:hypothetical protein